MHVCICISMFVCMCAYLCVRVYAGPDGTHRSRMLVTRVTRGYEQQY